MIVWKRKAYREKGAGWESRGIEAARPVLGGGKTWKGVLHLHGIFSLPTQPRASSSHAAWLKSALPFSLLTSSSCFPFPPVCLFLEAFFLPCQVREGEELLLASGPRYLDTHGGKLGERVRRKGAIKRSRPATQQIQGRVEKEEQKVNEIFRPENPHRAPCLAGGGEWWLRRCLLSLICCADLGEEKSSRFDVHFSFFPFFSSAHHQLLAPVHYRCAGYALENGGSQRLMGLSQRSLFGFPETRPSTRIEKKRGQRRRYPAPTILTVGQVNREDNRTLQEAPSLNRQPRIASPCPGPFFPHT